MRAGASSTATTPQYREARDESKFGRMLAFSEALPRLRERIERDLRGAGSEPRASCSPRWCACSTGR